MKRPTKQKVLQPDLRSDLGPLPWLLGFANIGFDYWHPRGPIPRLRRSRFLKYGDRRDWSAFGGKRTIELLEPGVERVTERYRGVTMSGIIVEDRAGRKTVSFEGDLHAPMTWELLWGFLAKHPPRRAVLVTKPGTAWPQTLPIWIHEVGDDYYPVDEAHAAPAGAEILSRLRDVRNVVRMFLHAALNLPPEPIEVRPAIEIRATIAAVIDTVHDSCAQLAGSRSSLPSWLSAEGDPLVVPHDIARVIWRNRVFVSQRMGGDGEQYFSSDSLPGIVWAELLNLATRRPLWGAIRCCKWCASFFTPSPRSRRPQEHCSNTCRQFFSDRAPGERRKP